MAGYREFQTGEVLTAANVDDFLAKQAVMKFADAAARDAALGTAVAGGNALREGMVAWLDDEDSVIAYDGSAWNPVAAEPPAGIGSNVVMNTLTTPLSGNTTFTTLAGCNVTITPSSADSKVLVIMMLSGTSSHAPILRRNGTAIILGDAAGSRPRATTYTFGSGGNTLIAYLDSPATTSAVTYDLQLRVVSTVAQVYFFNRTSGDQNDGRGTRTASTFIAIEVAG